jgi:lysozyme family protein
MTVADYRPFVDRMISMYEGGYGWDAQDPGGPTKYGITCYDLAEYLGQHMNSMTAWAPKVRAMTLTTAEVIYANKYASRCQFFTMHAGCDCAVFDFNVNSGVTGIKYAQRVVGTTEDGILGPITLAAINNHDPILFINELCAFRMSFLQSLGIWSTFHNGWTHRVNDLRAYCAALVNPKPMQLSVTPDYIEKPVRIPLAFAKAYAPGMLPRSAASAPSDYTIGTNAAIPIAMADAQKLVPEMFWGYITFDTVAPLVADVVKTSLDAVNAAHQPSPPTKEQLK